MFVDYIEIDSFTCSKCKTEFDDYTADARSIVEERVCLSCYIEIENRDSED